MPSNAPIPSAGAPAVCAGCNRGFRTLSGFHSHLRQRRNDERCLVMYRGYLAGLESISDSESANSDTEDEDSDPEDTDMATDTDTDMDPDSGFNPTLDTGLINIMDIDNEPEPEAPHQDSMDLGSGEEEVEEHPAEGGDGQVLPESQGCRRRQAERVLVDTGDGPKPHTIIRYTTKHGNSRAGSIINRAETHDNQYTSALSSSDNLWAPFKSKVDWEIARWAKMRGPGSTALTELLGVEGVSASY